MGSIGWEVSQLFGYCSGPIEPVSRIYAQHVDQECPVRDAKTIHVGGNKVFSTREKIRRSNLDFPQLIVLNVGHCISRV